MDISKEADADALRVSIDIQIIKNIRRKEKDSYDE
jgi:hypothetical protein